ncbi:MAG: hypothetical protein K6C36_03680 [Clostridia bacterium]|nr:hypothetical protein [Clostridia bacterium]
MNGTRNDVITGSAATVCRNFAGVPFTHKLTGAGRDRVAGAIDSVLGSDPGLRRIRLDETAGYIPAALCERGIITKSCAADEKTAVVYISPDEREAVTPFDGAHVRIRAFAPGLDCAGALERALSTAQELENRIPAAFDPEYGYLFSDPAALGTGVTAEVSLHLGSLAYRGRLAETAAAFSKLGLSLKPLDPSRGDSLCLLSDPLGAGISEEKVCSNLTAFALQLADLERRTAAELKNDKKFLSRAAESLGRLETSTELTYAEMTRLLGVMRVAVIAGVSDAGLDGIDRLLEEYSPAVMSASVGYRLDRHTRDVARAAAAARYFRGRDND